MENSLTEGPSRSDRGTEAPETTSGQAIGTGGANLQQTVVITGGSVKATDAGAATVAVNASGAALSCVEVPGLAPGAAVAFDGLPGYYGTSGICADAEGRVYLWLPENWATPVTPKTASASSPRLLYASSGVAHSFSANGFRYTVRIDAASGSTTSEKGDALALEDLRIEDFAVEDGWLLIDVSASPATWLHGFGDTLKVRASASLPIPVDAVLDLSGAEMRLKDGTRAVLAVPLGEKADSMFFSVGED